MIVIDKRQPDAISACPPIAIFFRALNSQPYPTKESSPIVMVGPEARFR
jgi:hypothetical protein